MKNRFMIFMGCVGAVAFGLKAFHASSKTEDWLILLYPVNALVGLFQSEAGAWIAGYGFYYAHLNILIDKSCAGVNFMIIVFCSLGTLSFRQKKSIANNLMKLLAALGFAYCLTILATTSRILTAIQLRPLKVTFPFVGSTWFHEAQGVLVYLTVVILAAMVLQLLNKKITIPYEKLS